MPLALCWMRYKMMYLKKHLWIKYRSCIPRFSDVPSIQLAIGWRPSLLGRRPSLLGFRFSDVPSFSAYNSLHTRTLWSFQTTLVPAEGRSKTGDAAGGSICVGPKVFRKSSYFKVVASLLLVERPGAPSSVLT